MYRVAAKISDSQINDLVADFCRSNGGCLRTILWKRDADGAIASTKLPKEKFDPVCEKAMAANPPGSATPATAAIPATVPLLCPEACNLLIAECFGEAKRFGTTTIANLTAFPELISRITPPIRTWWFAELIDVRVPDRANETVDRVIEFLKSAPNWGLAPHALFTASKNLYR